MQLFALNHLQWTVPQLPILIIYNSTWSILIQWIRGILSADNYDLVYTIEIVLPVCNKPYHMNNGFQHMWAEIKILWNHALDKVTRCERVL